MASLEDLAEKGRVLRGFGHVGQRSAELKQQPISVRGWFRVREECRCESLWWNGERERESIKKNSNAKTVKGGSVIRGE